LGSFAIGRVSSPSFTGAHSPSASSARTFSRARSGRRVSGGRCAANVLSASAVGLLDIAGSTLRLLSLPIGMLVSRLCEAMTVVSVVPLLIDLLLLLFSSN